MTTVFHFLLAVAALLVPLGFAYVVVRRLARRGRQRRPRSGRAPEAR